MKSSEHFTHNSSRLVVRTYQLEETPLLLRDGYCGLVNLAHFTDTGLVDGARWSSKELWI